MIGGILYLALIGLTILVVGLILAIAGSIIQFVFGAIGTILFGKN